MNNLNNSDKMEYGTEPLLKPNNKYQKAYNQFKEDFNSRFAGIDLEEYETFGNPFLDEFILENEIIIGRIFQKERELLNKTNTYFYGCSFDNYKHNYETRLNEFKAHYIDVNESDFIESELKKEIHYFITGINERQIKFSLKARKEFLNNRKTQLITQLNNTETEPINETETEQKIPYKIALLYEIGFFKLDTIKKLTKENQFNIITKLTGGTHRTIKGNVNVLDPNSNEDRIKYTSNNFLNEVKNYLNNLK
jgi:hypothetical protein